MPKKYLTCRKCGSVFHFVIPRGWFLKNVLFFLPIKTYFCAKCTKTRYVWITNAKEAEYEKI